ncbi:LLM class flavin-dependent oxidoreductase [Longimicrobium sp.]|uniref:LLM class flavin-dependent oxidoreductase n=1 Tax=Longimicrobium sp. TaxID=2029185 RepID=UPI003B3A2F1D
MTRLKLGVVDQSPVRTGGTAADALRETLELARIADRLGYSRYWLAEHHSTNSFAGSSPAVLIPRVASVTRDIRVGSGGVLLSHYSPLQVAENFRTLEALFPGRIDLGIGRAPGGDGRAALALQYGRGRIDVDRFPQQVEDLAGWMTDAFGDGHPWRRVRAMPRAQSVPELWMLGSGGSSAYYAADRGCGFSFAQFISGVDGAGQVRHYRDRFRPSAWRAEPAASVALGVICADTQAEAQRLASSMALWGMRIMHGRDRGIPSPDEALAEMGAAWTPPRLGEDGARMIAGDPAQIRDELHRIAARCAADELMIVTVTHDFDARVRSYELIAEAMGLEARGSA